MRQRPKAALHPAGIVSRIALVLALACALALFAAHAQPVVPDEQAEAALRRLTGDTTGIPSPSPALPLAGEAGGLRFVATTGMAAALGRICYENYAAQLAHNRRVFEWQLQSSRITFWMVLVIVWVGLVLSALQFIKSWRLRGPVTAEERLAVQTELELSSRGLKISSPVLGVIILGLSIAFFYLFLVHVYRIEYPTPSSRAAVQAQPAETGR